MATDKNTPKDAEVVNPIVADLNENYFHMGGIVTNMLEQFHDRGQQEFTIAQVVEALVSSKDAYVKDTEAKIAQHEETIKADGTDDKTKMSLKDEISKLQSDMRLLLSDKEAVQPFLEEQSKRKIEFNEKERERLAEFVKTLK